MKSILRLRLVGLAGAIVFFTYGMLIGAYPIAITNLVIIAIHSYFLRQLFGSKPVFTVLEVRQGSRYLEHFIDHYIDDIRQEFLPGFHYEPKPERYRAFILRDMVPTGLFICDLDGTDTGQGATRLRDPRLSGSESGPFPLLGQLGGLLRPVDHPRRKPTRHAAVQRIPAADGLSEGGRRPTAAIPIASGWPTFRVRPGGEAWLISAGRRKQVASSEQRVASLR